MRRRCLLVSSFVVFLLSSTRANADVVNLYQFTGVNVLLSGSFTLNTTVGFTITGSGDLGSTYTSTSSLNQLNGLLTDPVGLFTFSGANTLFYFNNSGITDPFTQWILRVGPQVMCPSCP